MHITVKNLQLVTIGTTGACAGKLSCTAWRPGATVPCIEHPVLLGPLSGATPVPLGFRLDLARCGNSGISFAVEVAVECQAAWWQRWLGRGPQQQVVAQGSMTLSAEQRGAVLELPLFVPPNRNLISSQDAPLDPVLEVDMPDQRLVLTTGDPNGSLIVAVSA